MAYRLELDGETLLASIREQLLTLPDDYVVYPGHGGAIDDPAGRLDWLMAHRRSREAEIMNALTNAPRMISAISADIYSHIPSAMLPAAERNVFAHLVYGAAESPVRHTVARGRVLLEDFRHTTLDPETIAEIARTEAPGLWKRFKRYNCS